MLRYEAKLYDLLVNQKDVIGINDEDARAVCDALEMDDTCNLYYLSKNEVMTLSFLSIDKKKRLWKLIEDVQNDPRFAPVFVIV
jgi:ribosomal protein S13